MDNILCHIMGMNHFTKEIFYRYIKFLKSSKNIIIQDIGEISSKIINDKTMNQLYDDYVLFNDKSKKFKSYIKKTKAIEYEMALYWKDKMNLHIKKFVRLNKDKKIILIGRNTYYRNARIGIDIDTKCKFFVKTDLTKHAKQIIASNLNKYRKDIVDGFFNLKYLDIKFLAKNRETRQNAYVKKGYTLKTLPNIIKHIKLNTENTNKFNKLDRVYVGLKNPVRNKITPFKDKQVISYSEPWLALLSILDDNNIKKGFYKLTRPYIREVNRGGFEALYTGGYLYEVEKDNFTYHEKGGTYKLVANTSAKILKRDYVPNINKYLDDKKIYKKQFNN
jgi:hypothetical protein